MPNASLHADYRSLSVCLLSYARKLNVPILAYTVNERHIAHALLQADVFAIFSDNPLPLLREWPPESKRRLSEYLQTRKYVTILTSSPARHGPRDA